MLQQTRVEAVIPYYHRFLERFPTLGTLARAMENDVLTAWSGLGYYSRARNLHEAARRMATEGLPVAYEEVLSLPGAGPYTAAAIASIALDLPHTAVDGNVMRVISRLTNDASEIGAPAVRRAFTAEAEALLDRGRPGDFNQAMMELGATVCVPRTPACGACPVAKFCAGRAAGRERELPVASRKPRARDVQLDLVLARNGARIFLVQRSSTERRMAGFWELPAKQLFPRLSGRKLSEFSHRIVNDRFQVTIWGARISRLPAGKWFDAEELKTIPLTTVTKKALTPAGGKSISARRSQVPDTP
jgi:A/G-specific adenine glycosylase